MIRYLITYEFEGSRKQYPFSFENAEIANDEIIRIRKHDKELKKWRPPRTAFALRRIDFTPISKEESDYMLYRKKTL
ncbi:hypothetical protein LCGC14_2880570 [marine sediment metagenome]|uniref:Uncharacterized protein n=1 Tax=marine sediment metagenome TaxID=412755 RepID=A0A0F9ARD9_9ZZZZ